MATEVLPATQAAATLQEYRMTKDGLARIQTIINEVMGGRKLGLGQLDRIRVPTGGGLAWTVPGFTGDEMKPAFEGIIVAVRSSRAFWETSFDENPGQPPTCVSDDGLTGAGAPGGVCADCPFAQFGSDVRRDGSAGRGCACREMRLLFVKTPGVVLPTVVVAPRTSIQEVQSYLLSLANFGYDYSAVITAFSLAPEKNDAGIKYAKMKLTPARTLDAEAAAQAHAYVQELRPFIQTTRVAISRQDVEG